ncbi:MAG: PDZ domain-containing protein [Planctomycetota bacterium]|nr:PDZ domain-containing protein [Planctomycetota bacterium]
MTGMNFTRTQFTIGSKRPLWIVGILAFSLLIGLGATQDGQADRTSESQSASDADVKAQTVQIYVSSPSGIGIAGTEDAKLNFGMFSISYDLDGQKIEVTMTEGDSYSVFVDGELLNEDQYRREKGHLFLIDEQGEVMKQLRLSPGWRSGSFPGYRLSRRARAEAFGVTMDILGEFAWVAGVTSLDSSFDPPPVMLGFFTRETSPALEKHLKLEPETTVMISGLHKTLPADKAGLQLYDIIVKVDDESPVSRGMILKSLMEKQPGDEMAFEVLQAGATLSITIELESFDRERFQNAEFIGRVPFRGHNRFRYRNETYPLASSNLQGIIVVPGQDQLYKLPEGENPIMEGELRLILQEFKAKIGSVEELAEFKLKAVSESRPPTGELKGTPNRKD